MSTYSGAYSNKKGTIYTGSWNGICVCDDNRTNDFCGFHGKYKDRYIKSEEKTPVLDKKVALEPRFTKLVK